MPKTDLSLREYLSSQHMPPVQQERLSKLMRLVDRWNEASNTSVSTDPYELGVKAFRKCADELESILESTE